MLLSLPRPRSRQMLRSLPRPQAMLLSQNSPPEPTDLPQAELLSLP